MRTGPSVTVSFGGDRSGQSAVIGVVLILGLVVVGTGAVVVLGSDAISQTKQATELQRAEHGMTLLDSRSAQVALGDSPSQSVAFQSSGDGSFHVESGGRIVVEHRNYSGTGTDETIYNASLGGFVYENGDTTIAYEGGGVWRTRDNGTRMISPPEFHYRDATLTLPVIRVNGSGGAAGSVTARVVGANRTRHVYPNASATYPNGEAYDNPVLNGTVRIKVQSRHYRGWASYFRHRTEGNVSEFPGNQTATVVLSTVDQVGEFSIVGYGGTLPVRTLAPGHSVDEFESTLVQGSSSNVDHVNFYAESGSQRWETVVTLPQQLKKYGKPPGDDCPIDPSDQDLTVEVYYTDGTGAHRAWVNDSVSPDSGAIHLSCDGDTPSLTIDMTGSTKLRLGQLQTGNVHWSVPSPNASYANFSQHHDSVSWESRNFTTSGTYRSTTIDNLTNHYFALLGPSFKVRYEWGPGHGSPFDLHASGGSLDYTAGGGSKYITFLHVTENEVRVRVR